MIKFLLSVALLLTAAQAGWGKFFGWLDQGAESHTSSDITSAGMPAYPSGRSQRYRTQLLLEPLDSRDRKARQPRIIYPKDLTRIRYECESISPSLEECIRSQIKEVFKSYNHGPGGMANLGLFENLYSLWSTKRSQPDWDMKQRIRFQYLETFIAEYAPDVSKQQLALFMTEFAMFYDVLMHPSRIASPFVQHEDEDPRAPMFLLGGGQWVPFHHPVDPDLELWTSKEVIDEVNSFLRNPDTHPSEKMPSGFVNVAVTSALLDSVATEQQLKIGPAQITHHLHPHLKQVTTRATIKLEHGWRTNTLSKVRWFNEFEVRFLVDKSNLPNSLLQSDKTTATDEAIPLDSVSFIAAYKIYEHRVRDWMEKAGIEIPFVSLEALELYADHTGKEARIQSDT